MEQLQWAIKVTTEYLDGHGGLDPDEQPQVELRECRSEAEALARFEALQDTLARGGRTPKYQRIAAVHLVSRPVGEWTAQASANRA